MERNIFRLNRGEWIVFAVGITGSLLARGMQLFSLSFSIDDYAFFLHAEDPVFYLNQGRWGAQILNSFFHYIGIESLYAPTLLVAVSLVGLVWIGIIICRFWKISENTLLSSLAVLAIILHPYQAEIYTFRIANINFIFPMFFAFWALYYASWKSRNFLLAAIGFMFSLSVYPIVLNYVLVAIVFSLVIEIVRDFKQGIRANYKSVISETKFIPKLASLALGVFSYLAVDKLVTHFMKIPHPAVKDFLETADISSRLAQLKELFSGVFFGAEPIIPMGLKTILVAIFLLCLIGIIRVIKKNNLRREDISNVAVVLLLLSAGILSTVGVLLALKIWWPVPRDIAAIGIFWAGIIAIIGLTLEEKIRTVSYILCGTVFLGFIGINNHIFVDQKIVNLRDAQKADRIVVRLEENPDFMNLKSLAIIGGYWGFESPLKTAQGDMNVSALSVSWSKVYLINQITGYNFLSPTKEENSEAEKYCLTAPKWPSAEAIKIFGTLGIVCL